MIGIHPYYEEDGVRTFKDSYILEMFDRVVKEGNLPTLFPDNSIQNKYEFLDFFKSGKATLYVITKHGEECAFIYLTDVHNKRANIHVCTYKKFYRDTVDVAEHVTKSLLNLKVHGEYQLNVLIGIISASNTLARKWIMKVGYKEQGVIPDYFWDAFKRESTDGVMYTATRKEF